MSAFPFSALVGQDALREALLVCAVDPLIGGVLVRGERGTAKSTAVRALAPLLPPVQVVEGDAFSREPAAGAAFVERAVRLVELPVGATADRLVGTLDLDAALGGRAQLQPGLLAAAHRGILYVDEVNLLPDHLVDVLLDAAAMGRNHVQRDGIDVEHEARFLLVGTMNPEEGDLRPQLLDRFGLSVDVAASLDPALRVEVVKRRLSFDADPPAFAARFAADDGAVAARVARARELLPRVRLGERTLLLIAATCARLNVDGMRADIVTARAASALAALDGASEVGEEHVRRAALLALAHRRRRGPLESPGLSEEELDEALAESSEAAPADEPRAPDAPAGRTPGGQGGEPSGDAEPPRPSDGTASDGSGAEDASPGDADAGAGSPSPSPAGVRPPDAPEPQFDPAAPAAPTQQQSAAAPAPPPLLQLLGRGAGDVGRRSRSTTGHPIDARAPAGPLTDLAPVATLRASLTRGGSSSRRITTQSRPSLATSDLREHVRAGKEGNLVVFCVDASGSMGAKKRMAAVKGAILGVLLDAYQRRDRVALVAFRGGSAELALAPTSSVERAAAALDALPTGGRSPIAAGLDAASALIARERRRDPERRALAVLVTDGRASGGRAGRTAARAAIERLAKVAAGLVVFDCEQGAVRLGLAGELAQAAGARLLPLSALHPATMGSPA